MMGVGSNKLTSIAPVFRGLLQALLGFILIFAGCQKAIDFAAFVGAVSAYALLPDGIVVLVATVLPWLEIVVGCAILVPRLARPAAMLLVALCGIFALAQIIAISRGLKIGCGCFGANSAELVSFATVVRTLAIAIAAGVLAILATKNTEKAGN